MDCKRFWDDWARLAAGETVAEARRHAQECPACAERLAQCERVVRAVRTPVEAAPHDLVVRAGAIMPRRPRLVARLLGNGLAMSGAARRGEVSDFALHVGVDGFSVRLQYTPVANGWEILGRAPTPDWSLSHEGGEVPCGASGRFRLVASSLGATSFVLRKDGAEIEVPSARELIEVGA